MIISQASGHRLHLCLRADARSTSASSLRYGGCPSLCFSDGSPRGLCISSLVRLSAHVLEMLPSLLTRVASLDFFEVALLLGTCLLVNYITADAQTNWVEGLIMISFYVMIVSVLIKDRSTLDTHMPSGCDGLVLPWRPRGALQANTSVRWSCRTWCGVAIILLRHP